MPCNRGLVSWWRPNTVATGTGYAVFGEGTYDGAVLFDRHVILRAPVGDVVVGNTP